MRNILIILAAIFLASCSNSPKEAKEAIWLTGTEEYSPGQVTELRAQAEQGDAEAQCQLGKCYYNGQGVAQDYDEAVKWYRKSADQGQAEAQFVLANCYYEGYGVEKDTAEAVRWLKKAAAQGYVYAIGALAELENPEPNE